MNIEPPKDAKGREIPLDTKMLYDRYGFKNIVKTFVYFTNTGTWRVKFTDSTSYFAVSDMHLNEPDSWEKLEEDLGRTTGASDAICAYFGGDNRDCVACRLNKEFFKAIPYCNPCLAFKDILNRIRKLRGEDNA